MAIDTARELAAGGAGLIVFPELWSSGLHWQQARELALYNRDSLFPDLVQADISACVLWGSFFWPGDGVIYNRALLTNEDGTVGAAYDKRHLFTQMEENSYLTPGKQRAVWAGPLRMGMAICYDLRFPELFRDYLDDGCEMFAIPAAWPKARIEHWYALLQARAIENQAYVIGVNHCGTFSGYAFGGQSALIGPRGEVLYRAGSEAESTIVDIDIAAVDEWRRSFPVLADRKKLEISAEGL
jgi:omega-amidase